MNKKNKISLARSSAAGYLSFVAAGGLKNVFTDDELKDGPVIRIFRITVADGRTYGTKQRQ